MPIVDSIPPPPPMPEINLLDLDFGNVPPCPPMPAIEPLTAEASVEGSVPLRADDLEARTNLENHKHQLEILKAELENPQNSFEQRTKDFQTASLRAASYVHALESAATEFSQHKNDSQAQIEKLMKGGIDTQEGLRQQIDNLTHIRAREKQEFDKYYQESQSIILDLNRHIIQQQSG